MVRGRYLVAALPRAPFLAKSVLMGKQWCWPQVVNWEGRGAKETQCSLALPHFLKYSPHPHQAGLHPHGTLTPTEPFPQDCSGTHRSPARVGRVRIVLKMQSLEAKNQTATVPDQKKALKGGSEDVRQCLL